MNVSMKNHRVFFGIFPTKIFWEFRSIPMVAGARPASVRDRLKAEVRDMTKISEKFLSDFDGRISRISPERKRSEPLGPAESELKPLKLLK